METRAPYRTSSPPPALPQSPPIDHPLTRLLGAERAARVLAGGKWRILLHVAGGEARKAEVTEFDVEIEAA